MADLIDRKALVEQLELLARYEDPFRQSVISGVVYTIKRAPALDAVEVVRCGECVNSREMDKYEKKLYLDGCVGCTRISSSYDSIMAPDDFCSYGVRREENAAD